VTSGSPATNSDGAGPGGLILSSNALYGTAYSGGSAGNGAIFRINTDGTGFTNLHSFSATSGSLATNRDGAGPFERLFLLGNILFGAADSGGTGGRGALFRINTDGTGFTNLHSFTAGSAIGGSSGLVANSDGAFPNGSLVSSGNALYGTTSSGGSAGNGTVFKMNTDGTGFTNLYEFTAGTRSVGDFESVSNSDGAYPSAGVILSGDTLYGTASQGGSSRVGTVFKVNADGSGFTNLHSFTPLIDGKYPEAGLVFSGNALYGTTSSGGSADRGEVFAVNADGTGFTTLYNFTATVGNAGYNNLGTNGDGAILFSGLVVSGNILYGMAEGGGSLGNGTVFSLSLPPPPLTITPLGTNVVLAWPTYAPGVILQSTTNLSPPAVWNTNFPSPALVNGLNTVTDSISVKQMFYRLIQ